MRIVATSDTHFVFDVDAIPDGDVLIHAGDLLLSGSKNEWKSRLKVLASLPHKTKILVPGNHDKFIEKHYAYANAKASSLGVTIVGHSANTRYYTLPNGMRMVGLPYVTNLPRWAYNREEEHLKDLVDLLEPADIVVSHSPPRGIVDHPLELWGVGAYHRYLDKHSPAIWICGHIHEGYGRAYVDDCWFYNVSMCDEDYEMVNKPTVIDL